MENPHKATKMAKKTEKIIKIEYRGFTITLTDKFRSGAAIPAGWDVSIYDDTSNIPVKYNGRCSKSHDAEIEAKCVIDTMMEED